MIDRQHNLGWGGLGVLAVLVICCLPDKAPAETLVLRNECQAPVVVQAASVVHGVLRRDRPYLLNYRDATPGIMMPGNKLITVYDAKVPNRILFQGAVPAGRDDLLFGILPDRPPPRVRLEMRPPPANPER